MTMNRTDSRQGVAAGVAAGPAVVVVADHVRARVFRADAPTAALDELQDLLHPDARLHEGDLVSDRSGRLDRGRGVGGSAAGSAQGAKRHEGEAFARQLCEQLQEVVSRSRATRLYVVAEPGFLGLLRAAMDPALRQLLAAEVGKSLVTHPLAEIRAALPARL
jgi:protein required for attachment to host cells